MQKTIDNPSSLFLRWNGDTGKYQGAQITRFIEIKDDAGRIISRGETAPMAVGDDSVGSFPLAEVLGEINVTLTGNLTQLEADKKALSDELQTTKQKLSEETRAKEAALDASAKATDANKALADDLATARAALTEAQQKNQPLEIQVKELQAKLDALASEPVKQQ